MGRSHRLREINHGIGGRGAIRGKRRPDDKGKIGAADSGKLVSVEFLNISIILLAARNARNEHR
jgi:hypothetical protein